MTEYERLVDDFIARSDRVLGQLMVLAERPKARTWSNRALLRGALSEFGKAFRTVVGDDLDAASTCSVIDTKARTETVRYQVSDGGQAMMDLARKAAWDLGLNDVPEVFYIRECADGEDHDIVQFTHVMGLYHKERNEVYVAAGGLSHREKLETFGHECYHALEKQEGRQANEDAADAYGRKFATWIINGIRV